MKRGSMTNKEYTERRAKALNRIWMYNHDITHPEVLAIIDQLVLDVIGEETITDPLMLGEIKLLKHCEQVRQMQRAIVNESN